MGSSGGSRSRLTDRFELKAQAGAGGMGTVYQAMDLRTGALAAVKILAVRNISDVARFDQEATVLQELAHPGIVRYVDHGLTTHGDPYIAMEWLEGETLDERLARGKLAPAGVAHLAARALDALAAAHAHGIVHRDIKPSNLYLVGWRLFDVRIIDFGVSRRVEDQKRNTRRGSTVGTPSYSSPEQARGEADIDGRADIFSLGCVLFECLSGRPPFHGPSAKEVLERICLTPVPSLVERCEDLDPELGELIDGMLVQDRNHRLSDARDLAARFRQIAIRLGAAEEQGLGTGERGQPPEGLGLQERRMLCGLLLDHDPSLPTDDQDRHLERIGGEAGLVAAAISPTSRLAWQKLPGPVSDQINEVTRAASLLRTAMPGLRQSVAVGRAVVVAGSLTGPLADSLTALLPAEPGTVHLDETVARLLPLSSLTRGSDAPGAPPRWLRPDGGDSVLVAVDSREPPLTGRERELERLMDSLAECRRSESAHLVLYEAGAGVGKSRLARALVSEARSRAAPTAAYLLRGRRDRAASPYALVGPLLRSEGSQSGRDGQLGDSAPAAARQAAFVEHLSIILERHPVLVVCDDLQWADRQSLRLLEAALRELRQRPFLLVGFSRPEPLPTGPLDPSAAAEHLLAASRVSHERLRLPPLSRDAGQTLLAWHRGRTTADIETYVFDRWQGNPFYLAELALVASPQTLLAPDTVLGEVEPLLARLDEEPRRVLRAASLLGDRFEFEAVLSLLGLKGRRSLEEALAALADADLVRRLGTQGGTFAFRSKLVREAAYALLTAGDRERGTARARQWLEEAGKTLPELLLDPAARPRPASDTVPTDTPAPPAPPA